MKKIDLHLHTISSVSDVSFEFSIETLKRYVSDRKIDCIAITNHNLFDIHQFNEIKESVDIIVYPGIELDLEGGHLLLIAPETKIDDFSSKCDKVSELIKTEKDRLSVEDFKSIFKDYKDYLLIPHYKKKPMISEDVMLHFKEEIFCGEVKNPKDFKILKKNKNELTPVLFSDIRLEDSLNDFSFRQTFILTDDLNLSSIKQCLKDKNKVFLNNRGEEELIQILDDGTLSYNGLNVIFGERSSGKTMTLEKIMSSFENVKYIKQFSLIEKSDEKEEEQFRKKISLNKNEVSENYMKEFKCLVDEVININIKEDDKLVEGYLESLKSFANESDKLDSFSKAKLFNENTLVTETLEELSKLIAAVEVIVSNKKYSSIINDYVNYDDMINLLKHLIILYREKYRENYYIDKTNNAIKKIKNNLNINSSNIQPKKCDIINIYKNRMYIDRFNELFINMKKEREIVNEEHYGYKIQCISKQMNNATDVRNVYGKKVGFSDAYTKYNNGFEYLNVLKDIGSIPTTELYRLFIKFEYNILNKYGLNVSGGERSEFNLLSELSDASNYDMLLIDEPESSFDNIFLNSSVNAYIKKISENIPVFVVTHNSTIGQSIRPDYLLYTKRNIINSQPFFSIFGGYPTSKTLENVGGEKIDNYIAIINSLEGGVDTYNERKQDYEDIRNK